MQCIRPIWLESAKRFVFCKKCIACKVARTREWSVRMLHEMSSHEVSVFATLTYSEDNIPSNGSISKSELQRFFKRLRKRGCSLKYYASGEYGEQNGRPHYHAIIFGLSLKDRLVIEDAWRLGIVHLGTVTYDSCRYVAQYIDKVYYGDMIKQIYGDREQPFQLFSKGLGKNFILKNGDYLREKKGCTVRGVEVGVPRYYKNKLELEMDRVESVHDTAYFQNRISLSEKTRNVWLEEWKKEIAKNYQREKNIYGRKNLREKKL